MYWLSNFIRQIDDWTGNLKYCRRCGHWFENFSGWMMRRVFIHCAQMSVLNQLEKEQTVTKKNKSFWKMVSSVFNVNVSNEKASQRMWISLILLLFLTGSGRINARKRWSAQANLKTNEKTERTNLFFIQLATPKCHEKRLRNETREFIWHKRHKNVPEFI